MAIFNSYVKLPEGNPLIVVPHQPSWHNNHRKNSSTPKEVCLPALHPQGKDSWPDCCPKMGYTPQNSMVDLDVFAY